MALRNGSVSVWIGLASLLASCLSAQPAPRLTAPEVEVRNWTAEHGMPDAFVSSIQQTKEGFLWIGTPKGLARFDGWAFQLVNFADKVPADGPVAVTAQCVDSANRLWIGTEKDGVFWLDPTQVGRLRAVPEGLAGEKILCLGSDEASGVWIGTERGLVKAERGGFVRIPPDPADVDPAVLSLQVTRSNGVWVTTRAGLRRYQHGRMEPQEFQVAGLGTARFLGVFEDRHGSLWGFGDTYLLNVTEKRRFNYFRGGGATPLQVWSICEGRPGQLWIGTSGQGLFHFSGTRFHAVDLHESPDHSNVRAVFVDQGGQVWVGTEKGLLRLRERIVRWYTAPQSAATCLTEDSEGRVWAGFEHGGLASGRLGLLEPAGLTVPLASQNLISSLYGRGDGSLWVGTIGNGLYRMREGKVLRYGTAEGLTDDTVTAICGTVGGRVWVGTSDGRMHRFMEQVNGTFGTSSGLTGHPVTALVHAGELSFWLGTSEGEVLWFEAQRFRALPRAPGLAGFPITALRQDSSKALWVGTRGGGLGCYAGKRWQVWNVDSGLPDNSVLGIEQSLDGGIWVATGRGIIRLPADWRDREYQRENRPPILVEFPSSVVEKAATGGPRSLRSRDGTLWFATDHGTVNFHPAELNLAAPAPEVRIEQVRANNQPREEVEWAGKHRNAGTGDPAAKASSAGRDESQPPIRLPADLREVEFRFTAPGIAYPERTRFRHKLEGFDPDWQDSTATRKARYGKLPAGSYRFYVTATDSKGTWSGPETHLELMVPPPVWRSPWAVALQVLLLVTVVASVARVVSHRRLRRQLAGLEQQQAMERERARIAQDMHDELGAKLTKISFLSERARNDVVQTSPTSAQLDSIAFTSRELLHSLDEIVWAVNPRNDTLEHLAAYLAQYATEYLQNTQVQFDLRMPGALPDRAISAEVRHHLFLAFEEALSNALKHSGASHIRVQMVNSNDEFQVQIKDDGRGLPSGAAGATGAPDGSAGSHEAKPGGGVHRRRGSGLNSMRERLTRSGGRCQVQSTPKEGTTVTLSIPLARHSALNQAPHQAGEKPGGFS